MSEFLLGVVLAVLIILVVVLYAGYKRYRAARKAGASRADAISIMLAGGPQPPP